MDVTDACKAASPTLCKLPTFVAPYPLHFNTKLLATSQNSFKVADIANALARLVRPFPSMIRALRYAKGKLEAAGVNLVTWDAYDHPRGWDILRHIYYPDAGRVHRKVLEEGGEPIHPLTEWALSYGKPNEISLEELWDLNIKRDEYRAEYVMTM